MSTPNYAIFHLVRFTPAWLALPREDRRAVAREIEALVAASAGAVSIRWFDAEAFSAKATDVLFVETRDLFAYYRFWEHVRDTTLFTVPYVHEEQIVVSIEQGHRLHEAHAAP
jgi:hypothetical protein